MSDVTHILSAIEEGVPHAAEQRLPLVYNELRSRCRTRWDAERLVMPWLLLLYQRLLGT